MRRSCADAATEDLHASPGTSPGAVQVTPIWPSMDLRAAAMAAHRREATTGINRGFRGRRAFDM
ncbi:MAG TPA: hypothetical protein VHN14_33965 [Kofleriaceae bacterium]|jgi:hypothetical protein|nr:hypothetical protein [Kofleriaceae bacterium]